MNTADQIELTGAIPGRRTRSNGLSLWSDLFPGIMQRKNWPHTKGGAENSHGSNGYEENIYASTHPPLRQ
jgi:hypothetical protein